ncbi:MAG: MerR family transcriptional regulator [Lentimicrobium sp.]|jgi:DNA-binding transcriptional MerR regulator|nr:MerR family transcriptional regulator [Lentimicrobium sp.]
MFYTGEQMIKYSIKDLEQLTGIKAHTIRIWEKRYQFISPERTSTNIRYYSDSDLKKLLNVSILNREGVKISTIVNMSNEEINERIMSVSETSYDYDNQIEQLVISMIDLDESRFDRILSSSVIKLGFDDTVIKVLYPFFEKIGILWQIGTVYPAQEHFVSNLVRQKLIIAIDGQSGSYKPDAKTFLLYLPSNEWHELGLLFYSYLVKKTGYKVIYLGQSVPFEDLLEVNRRHQIDYFLTSITTPVTQRKYAEYLQQMSQAFTGKKVFITGYQTNEFSIHLPINVVRVSGPEEFLKVLQQEE